MERLNELYQSLDDCGVLLFEEKLPFTDALVIEVDGIYGLFTDHSQYRSVSEELVSIAHECGHVFTGSLHNLENRGKLVNQDECRANRWAIKKLLPFDDLRAALHLGYTTHFELADYFNVTEKFVQMAFDYYIYARGLSFA